MRALQAILLVGISLALGAAALAQTTYPLAVFPPEHRFVRDPLTGAQLLFITTDPAEDHNLYFHERSFLSDNSAVLFYSKRAHGGLMAYLFQTGELVRLVTPQGGVGGATAAREGNRIYGVRGDQVIELTLHLEPSPDPNRRPSKVTATERVICTMPQGMGLGTALNENSDGTLLAASAGPAIVVINTRTGEIREVCEVEHAGHVQFSRQSPYLLSFAGRNDRLWVVDVREGKPRCIHHQAPDELVTHECWWINDTLTFCGGYRDKETDVKVIDPRTGEIRIVGVGAWVPFRSPGEDVLDRWNWWHAAGFEGGGWIVADNWYGDLVLFDPLTTQMHRLTLGHRKYGAGTHPEPGWDRTGTKIVFNSQMLGPADVCVVTVPDTWQADPGDEGFVVKSLSRDW